MDQPKPKKGRKTCVVCGRGRDERMYHLIPSDADRRSEWLKAIGKEALNLPKSTYVCESHFRRPEDYFTREYPGAQWRLLKTAVPNQNIPQKPAEQDGTPHK